MGHGKHSSRTSGEQIDQHILLFFTPGAQNRHFLLSICIEKFKPCESMPGGEAGKDGEAICVGGNLYQVKRGVGV